MLKTGLRRSANGRFNPTWGLVAAAFCFLISLGSLLPTYALEAEARTIEPWYDYKSIIGFDYVAHVQPGKYYPGPEAKPESLAQVRLPVDPPTYQRVLISQFTDRVTITLPYSFTADRDADMHLRLRVDGAHTLPGVWQQEMELVPEREWTTKGKSVTGEVTVEVPVARLLADLLASKDELQFGIEPLEIRIRPVFEVLVDGLKEPVAVSNAPEFVLALRTSTVEVPEPAEKQVAQLLTETKTVPVTVSMFGYEMKVALLRTISLYSFGGFVLLSGAMLLLRRKKGTDKEKLGKLGPNVVKIRAWEPPAFTAMATVRSVEELLQLHVRTEQPIMKLGNTYYLMEGMTCYKLELGSGEALEDTAE